MFVGDNQLYTCLVFMLLHEYFFDWIIIPSGDQLLTNAMKMNMQRFYCIYKRFNTIVNTADVL